MDNNVFDNDVKNTRDVGTYTADNIQVLEGLEAVRKRPGMYIGTTSSRGLHHLVYEIVDNSVDEALAGFCTHIEVSINPDGSVTVSDDGRGIPVGINHKTGRNAVDLVFTELHAGGKFGGGGYKVSGGLHGVGASVVNALSEWLDVKIKQGGVIYHQRFSRGATTVPLEKIGTCDPEDTGSTVSFLPDPLIFKETTVFEYDILKQRMREMAFLRSHSETFVLNLLQREKSPQNPGNTAFTLRAGSRSLSPISIAARRSCIPRFSILKGARTTSTWKWLFSTMTPTETASTASSTISIRPREACIWSASEMR